MKRLLVILGTRPEAIKMCNLIKELKGRREIDVKVLSTGQHKDMLDDALAALAIPDEIIEETEEQ